MINSAARILSPYLVMCSWIFGSGGAYAANPATTNPPAPSVTASAPAPVPWLYVGSDVPVDKDWIFGTLPNGLRYAVRRNAVPEHQVSVRVVVDAGSLMESNKELGYAHFMEHLSFRGSKYAGDGEAIKVWQRLGTTFGSDTNAQTTAVQTIYKLDLPNATRAGLTESLKLLSGMMAAPSLTPNEVDEERRTVMAEARESGGADVRLNDASRALFYGDQLLASRAPIGTSASLLAATAKKMRAFHERWYRPERTVVVIAGDVDPAVFVQMLTAQFGDWKGVSRAPKEPDFGVPTPNDDSVKIFTDAGLPMSLSLAYLRPWVPHNDTIVYNQGNMIVDIARRILNRRLETRARAGLSFLSAAVDQSDVSRSVDETLASMTPLKDDWQRGLADMRGMIAAAMTTPPSQAEIDREVNEFVSDLNASVEQAKANTDGQLADSIASALAIRETVASPVVARDIFGTMQGKLTPDAILQATRHLFSGVGPRAMLSTPATIPDGAAKLRDALSAPAVPLTSPQQVPISFDRLPKFGPPGKVIAKHRLAFDSMRIVDFANGSKLMLYAIPGTSGRVFVTARFGNGRRALPVDRPTAAWSGAGALMASGMVDLGENEYDRLTSGRRIGIVFETEDDAFTLKSLTNASDLTDDLKLMAAKLAFPRWDAAPVERLKAAVLAGEASVDSTPQGVLGRDLEGLLVNGDPRWATPTKQQVTALTPASFRALWEPLLKAGPVELMIFGDVNEEEAIKAAAATFGAMKPRPPAPIVPESADVQSFTPSAVRIIRTHKGDADQAAAVLAWPTAGGMDTIYEARKLDILAAIFNGRLFDRLREGEGAAYSPNVSNNWRDTFKTGGSFAVISQLKPASVEKFFEITRAIAQDLAAKPVSEDEFERAIGPRKLLIARAETSELYWMGEMAGATRDRRKIDEALSIGSDLRRITPTNLQETAKKYLLPDHTLEIAVLPEKK